MDEIAEALSRVVQRDRVPTTQIAVLTEQSDWSVRRWLHGKTSPSGRATIILMRKLPGFAEELGFRPAKGVRAA